MNKNTGLIVTAGRFAAVMASTRKHASLAIRADRNYPGSRTEMHKVMRSWGREVLGIMNARVTLVGSASPSPTLFVGNHVSYLDIPLLMSQAPVVFIAKQELARWPYFGRAMRSVGTVFVDRESTYSRKGAAEKVAPYIQKTGQSVAIFPSGTTSADEGRPWRWGAFLIAKRYGIPLQPFRLRYTPQKAAAFVGNDTFAPHLWRLLRQPTLSAEIEFGEPFQVNDPQEDALHWWAWTREKLIETKQETGG